MPGTSKVPLSKPVKQICVFSQCFESLLSKPKYITELAKILSKDVAIY